MPNRGQRLIAALCAACLVSGCAGSPAAPHAVAATPSRAPERSPAAGSSFTVAGQIDVAASARDAGPRQLTTIHTLTPSRAAKGMSVLALGPRGEIIAAANPAPARGPDPKTGQSTVGTFGPKGFSAFPAPADRDRTPREAGSADTDGRIVAWAETGAPGPAPSWQILGYDVTARRTRVLGNPSQLGARSGDLDESAPTVGNGRVYWSVSTPSTGRALIVARPADGSGTVQTVVEGGKHPEAHGDLLYYVRSADVAPGFPGDRYEIHRRAADGTDTVAASGPLTKGQRVGALAASGDTVSWAINAGDGPTDEPEDQPQDGRIIVWNAARNSATVVILADPGPTDLSADAGLLTWGNGSGSGDAGEYVLDIAAGRVWRLHTQEGASIAFTGGRSVAWSSIDGSGSATPAAYTVASWRP